MTLPPREVAAAQLAALRYRVTVSTARAAQLRLITGYANWTAGPAIQAGGREAWEVTCFGVDTKTFLATAAQFGASVETVPA